MLRNITWGVQQVLSVSNLRIDLTFKSNLAKTANLQLYAVFGSHIEITQTRDVITEYRRIPKPPTYNSTPALALILKLHKLVTSSLSTDVINPTTTNNNTNELALC